MALRQLSACSTSGRGPCLPERHACPRVAGCARHPPRRMACSAMLDPTDLVHHVTHLVHHAPLAYEPIASPCSLMNCGDVVHRSTLDPVLRKEVAGPDWKLFALLATVGAYMSLTPGVLAGAWDYYVAGPLQRQNQRPLGKEDLKLGKRLGAGGFGSVYRAELTELDGSITPVVVKKAKEFGEAEVWMNERMSRCAPAAVARYLGAFQDQPGGATKVTLGKPAAADSDIWIVWAVEGDSTLADLMLKRDWPYNLEPLLLQRELTVPKGKRRALVSIKLAMQQLLEDLAACHAVGIVHRDIKPQNVIAGTADARLKLIDLGAAADLRLGINYQPNQYLLDPRYAPPQQYIMSRQTPSPPPKPVAALLSPVLWAMEHPDKFDMYSVGLVLLQMAFPCLRTDNALIAFRKRLEECNWDLRRWRASEVSRRANASGVLPRDLAEGFEVLDLEGGAGWDLACKLVAYKPSDRLTASEALEHPWFETSPGSFSVASSGAAVLGTVTKQLGTVSNAMAEALPSGVLEEVTSSVEEAFTHGNAGGLTEAQLAEEFGYSKAAPSPSNSPRQTIAWWQDRQTDLQRRRSRSSNSRGGSPVATPSGSVQVKVRVNGSAAKVLKGPSGKGGAGASPASSVEEVTTKVKELLGALAGRR